MLKGSLSTAITLFFVQGLRFVSGVLIGRYYGVKEALQKLIPELREKYNLKTAYAIFLKGNQLILIFSLIAAVLLYFISPWLTTYWNEPYMLWLFRISALFLPFYVLGELNYFSLRAALKVHTANMSLVLPTIIRLLVLLVITYYFFDTFNPIYLHWSTICFLPWLFSLIPIYKYFHQPAAKEEKLQTVNHQQVLSVAFPMVLAQTWLESIRHARIFPCLLLRCWLP